ncbi:MAG: EamA family transporter [Treponema sp.]|nr:EamA family transporter [Treponema sp.]
MIWMLLVLVYGLLKGSREIAKKLAMNKNSVMEVLVVYTFISFLFVIPQAPNAGGLEPKFFIFIALKSFCIFLAWICSFRSLKKLPVSLYGILDLSRMIFATSFGVIFLHEILNLYQIIGLITVCVGLLLLKFKPKFLKKLFHIEESPVVQNNQIILEEKTHSTTFYVILAFISCFLNAVSGFFDKVLMKDITSSQLQFWYMLFLIGYYLIYVLITRTKISLSTFKNIWVWLLAIMFVIGDKALFIANGMPESRITVMTLIKQSGCLVTIIGGKFIFKEKNTGYRFFCAAIVIIGIVIGVL